MNKEIVLLDGSLNIAVIVSIRSQHDLTLTSDSKDKEIVAKLLILLVVKLSLASQSQGVGDLALVVQVLTLAM